MPGLNIKKCKQTYVVKFRQFCCLSRDFATAIIGLSARDRIHCVFVAAFPTSYTCALRADIHLADRLLRPDTVPVRKRGVLMVARLAMMPRLSR